MNTIRARLLRDIVIPAGTLFHVAPIHSTRAPGHVEHLIALTPDCTGRLILDAASGDPQMADWVEILEQE